LLDDNGFMVTCGFTWRPRKILWKDVDEFFVYRLGRGSEAIGFNFKRQPVDHSRFADAPLPPQASGSLPQGWDQAPEAMALELNRRREQALRAAT
jgi:hypothetical protein